MPRVNDKHRLVCLLALLAFFNLAGCKRQTDPSWQQVQARGVIRVGMEANWLPFEYIDSAGQLQGFDVELARALGDKLGLEVQFMPTISFDGFYDALTADHVDVIISAVVINPDQTADYAYSTPYFNAGQVLVRPAQQQQVIQRMQDLNTRTLAVELGSEGDRLARYWARRLQALTISHYDSTPAALQAVADGQADAALSDRSTALMYCAAHGLRISQPVTAEQYALVTLRKNAALLNALDVALHELQTEGALQQLEQKWLCESPDCCQ